MPKNWGEGRGMPARFRLTRDGKSSVKVSGKRRQVYEVPFLDRYRRRAFKNFRLILEHSKIKVVGLNAGELQITNLLPAS